MADAELDNILAKLSGTPGGDNREAWAAVSAATPKHERATGAPVIPEG